MAMRYEEARPLVGAIIRADRADFADAGFADECRELLEERSVLVFPEANLTDEEQIDFTDLLGERSDYGAKMPDRDGNVSEIYKVTLDPEVKVDTQYVYATWFWHMDGVTAVQDPPAATLLSARNVAGEGGETEFASTLAAYAALPERAKAKLDGLRGCGRCSISASGRRTGTVRTASSNTRSSGRTNRAASRWCSACSWKRLSG
jgi:alpha-ketoglutarate-dependent taurine dioxygenase